MMKEYPSSLTFRFIISGFVFDSCSLYLCSRSSLHLHISRLPAREGFSWRKWQFFLKRIFGLEFFLLIFTSEGFLLVKNDHHQIREFRLSEHVWPELVPVVER